jgi:hypothetical protein
VSPVVAVASLRPRGQSQSAPSCLQNATLARIQVVPATSVLSEAGDVPTAKQCHSCDPSNLHSWLQRWISRWGGVAWGHMRHPVEALETGRWMYHGTSQPSAAHTKAYANNSGKDESNFVSLTPAEAGSRGDKTKERKGYEVCTYHCYPSACSRHLTLCSFPWLDGI